MIAVSIAELDKLTREAQRSGAEHALREILLWVMERRGSVDAWPDLIAELKRRIAAGGSA